MGGLFVLRFKSKLRLILSYSAGALLGVSFFDLLPTAHSLLVGNSENPNTLFFYLAVSLGFLIYFFLSLWIKKSQNYRSGDLGAGSLVIHSILDGVTIGLAFKASSAIGVAVALAVITHDFSDGVNTVSVVMRARAKTARAIAWLALDAIAPVIGVGLASLIQIPKLGLGGALATIAGCLLYIALIDLLPESFGKPYRLRPFIAFLAGILSMFIVVRYGT